jgi:hypothetical protein
MEMNVVAVLLVGLLISFLVLVLAVRRRFMSEEEKIIERCNRDLADAFCPG